MRLLISDLDGTLLGDDRALDGFAVWYEQVQDQLRLVYSSGRFLDSVRDSIDEFHLPEPAAIICGVGTEIHDLANGGQLAGWPNAAFGWNAAAVRAACEEYPQLLPQPEQLLSDYKISYYAADLDDATLRRLAQHLEEYGLETSIVYSSNRDLDILPAATNKGTAATFLARHWDFDHDQVIVAGDSGNDLAMFSTGFRGIVVGNAQPELLALRGPYIYRAQAPYAAGVLEGLQHWLDDFWPTAAAAEPIAARSIPGRDASHGRRG